jgi:ParB-like chromosome segregation protein Spo0J
MAEKRTRKPKGAAEVQHTASKLERLEVTYVAIDSIHPNQYNPNRQSDDDFALLLKSMSDDGFTQPVIVQQATREIVDGEHRWRAAHQLGYSEIPIVLVEMTPEQMRVATLRHNRARGSEDLDLTAALLRDLQTLGALDWAQDSLLLDDVELNALLEVEPVPEVLASEEYGEAWAPGEKTDVRPATGRDIDEGHTESMTVQAVQNQRDQEKRIAAAVSEEEKAAARRDNDVYRLTLAFSGEEGRIVKTVLGDTPAQKLLLLCQAQLDEPGTNGHAEE